MVARTLRVIRRPKGSPVSVPVQASPRALTAASQLIVDPQKQLARSTFGATREDWQLEAWNLSEEVGELGYYVSWRANSCSRVTLVASEIDPETGLPTGGLSLDEDGNPSAEGKRVAEIFRAIAGGPLGQAELIKRTAECLTVPGELWIVILVRSEKVNGKTQKVEKWYAVTREEIIRSTAGGAKIELPDGTKHEYNSAVDTMVRVWNPRPRKASQATSPVRACLEPLREIVRTSRKIKNAARSRMMNNGVLFLPQGMSLPAANAPIPEDQADIPGIEVPTVTGVTATDKLAHQLLQAAIATSEDENAAAGYIPLMATVPDELVGKILHLKFGNEVTEVEIKTRIDAITRLAMGLDVSPERLLGMSKGNHWSAWQIGDEDVQLHIKPVMDNICRSIYDHILRPILARENIDPDKYTLWYDASGLTADPDLTDEAFKAHEAGAIRSEALRRLVNLGEDNGYDMTTVEGCQEFARDALTRDPTLIATYWPIIAAGIPELEAIEIQQPVAALPPGQDDENEDDEGSGAENQREPDTEDDSEQQAAAILASSAEMIVVERLLVNRALELAGRRRVNTNDRQQKARLAGIPARDYHRYLPAVSEADVPKLINGYDVGLADDVIGRLGVDTDALRSAVRRAVTKALTQPVIDAEVVG